LINGGAVGILAALLQQKGSPVPTKSPNLPQSLKGHAIPPERLELIAPHMEGLAATALAVSDELPLQADVGDFVAVLEAEEA
jgi:hypothetical protein